VIIQEARLALVARVMVREATVFSFRRHSVGVARNSRANQRVSDACYMNPSENSWHNDATWREIPPTGAVLCCVVCPPMGGDTMWAKMELAYGRLPDRIRGSLV
jgi:alpha-ketoglutarate-dependent taurine dioxygenase